MLVLERNPNQRVVIRVGNTLIRVMGSQSGDRKVKLAFDAPRHVLIDREEFWTRREARGTDQDGVDRS